MSEQILSSDEVDAILKVTQEKTPDLSQMVGNNDTSKENQKPYAYALTNINESFRSECEKNFSAFLRKKLLIKTKSFNLTTTAAGLGANTDKVLYSILRISPNAEYGMFITDLSLLHQTINLLYGGKINSNEKTIETPGKVGTIIAEKICHIFLGAFAQACAEYGEVTSEIIKTTTSQNLASNLGLDPDTSVYMVEFIIFFEEIETSIKFMFSEEFLEKFIPVKEETTKHKEKDFWRTAIKSQVVDSIVTINISMPDVNMKVREFMELKEGDLIQISDPTAVYVCLNNLKLFRAVAGQSNSKRVAKIINQI